MNRTAPLALLAALLLAGGCGNESADHSAAPADTAGHAMPSGSMDTDMAAMNDRMVAALGPADSSYDDRFIDLMIPHHQGAVAMARDARTKAVHPELRAFADSVVAMQEREIRQLEEWRRAWYGH